MISGSFNLNDCKLFMNGIEVGSATFDCDINSLSRYETEIEIVDQNSGNKEKVKASVSKFNNDVLPEKVIFNGNTTILIDDDDDKYIVRCSEDDEFNPVFGFLYGYFLMNNRMSKTQAAKFFDNLEKCARNNNVKERKVENVLKCKQLTLDDYVREMKKAMK